MGDAGGQAWHQEQGLALPSLEDELDHAAGDQDGWLLPESVVSSGIIKEVAEQTSYGEIFLSDLIRRQRRLALSVAAVFLLLLFGLPLLNLLLPSLVALPILGLPLSWLLVAVAIYPLLWGLALYFTTTARAVDDEFVKLIR